MVNQPTQATILSESSDKAKQPFPRRTEGPQRTNTRGLTQAYEIRDVAAAHAIELRDMACHTLADKALRARALKDNSCVWQIATTTIRIFRGKPLPGSLRPEPKKPKRISPRAIPSEDPPAV